MDTHLVDMWSWLTISVFIDPKIPKSAIYATVFNWVGAGYGVMKSDLKDKGGEFCVDEIGEVSSILII